jgi:hypothetical protein
MPKRELSPIWKKKVRCPLCDSEFYAYNVRSEAIKVKSRDTDFMVIYDGINPNWYLVWVCPKCYYSAFKADFHTLSDREKTTLAKLSDVRMSIAKIEDFSGERTANLANLSYELAVHCYQHRRGCDEKIANAYLREGWIARELGEWDHERECLKNAALYYKRAFETAYDLQMGRTEIMYLIGELERRLENYQIALKYFAKVFDDKKAKSNIANLARDQYHLAKDGLEKAKKSGLYPEESTQKLKEEVREKREDRFLDTVKEDAGTLEDLGLDID